MTAGIPQIGWSAVANKLDGRATVRHAVLTANGTWGEGQVQYPSDVVNGLAQYVNPDLVYEVPVPYPASFGPIGGPLTGPSYQESVQDAVDWMSSWITNNPLQTFAFAGYSQGAEATSRVMMALMDGSLPGLDRCVGGVTWGNPCRGAGFHAPTIKDPGGHGISPTRMTTLPIINDRAAWADYVHSPANGDAALDMYASVPNGTVGDDMVEVYQMATNVQLHSPLQLAQDISDFLQAGIKDVEKAPLAAVEAAVAGLQFLAAPGGPTASHISYLGEIPGYSNQVADAVGFLHDLCTAVPARCAA